MHAVEIDGLTYTYPGPRPLYIKIRPAGRVSPTYVSGLWP